MLYVLSVIIGSIIFYILLNVGQEEKSSPIERLSKIKFKASKIDDEEATSTNISHLMKETEFRIEALGRYLNKFNFFNVLKKELKIADINLKPDAFILISIIPASVFFLVGILKPQMIHVFIILSAGLAAFPTIMLKMKVKKRYSLFTSQFPDALNLIASSLRSGHSLLSGFQMVSREMPEPVNQVFKTVSDDISMGLDTRNALDNMADCMPMSIDLRFFVTAVLIQREIGGNLAEILDTLNYTIRERFKLLGQIATQTAQAKMSGIVLACAPFAIGAIIKLLNPTYLDPLFKTIAGQCALITAILMAGFGYMIINKITNIRV